MSYESYIYKPSIYLINMRAKVRELFKDIDADSILLASGDRHIDTNFYYFSEMSKMRHLTGFMVLRNGRKPLVIADPREYKIFKNRRSIDTVLFKDGKDLQSLLGKALSKKIGIDHQWTSLLEERWLKKLLKGREFIDVSNSLSTVRSIKTNKEIRKISEACKITEEIIGKVVKTVKEGQIEKEIAKKLDIQALSSSEGASFPTIVASGRNSATPHHIPGKAKIKKGDILLIDFGVIHEGYCSDLTRTFVLGNANVMQKHVYATVYKAQRSAIAAIKEGVKAKDVFNIANKIIKQNFGKDMIHALGHGLGILVHDFPQGLHKKADYKLKQNMVLTVEPGYYGPFGVRIEADVAVTTKGCKLLSDASPILVGI